MGEWAQIGGLGAVCAAFLGMLRILAKPESRWQSIVEHQESELDEARVEIARLRARVAELES